MPIKTLGSIIPSGCFAFGEFLYQRIAPKIPDSYLNKTKTHFWYLKF
jgi:hypothetical protein